MPDRDNLYVAVESLAATVETLAGSVRDLRSHADSLTQANREQTVAIRSERNSRRLLWIPIVISCLALVIGAIGFAQIRDNTDQLVAVSASSQAQRSILLECTTPSGSTNSTAADVKPYDGTDEHECFEESQKRTALAITTLTRHTDYAALCAVQGRVDISQCVQEQFAAEEAGGANG